jgi:hypothetical protein
MRLKLEQLTTWTGAAVCLAAGLAAAKPGTPAKSSADSLPFPDEAHSLETLHRSVTAIGRFDGRIITMPTGLPFGIETPFKSFGASRLATFGAITDSTRKPVLPDDAGKIQTIDWRGIDVVGHKALFLNGSEMAMIEADATTLKMVARRSIPWDMLKPAADPQGEPTAPEIAATRSEFKRQLMKTLGTRFAGMAPLPKEWFKTPRRAYLLATRIPSFPLLVMECDPDDPSSCMITRQCHLEGEQPKPSAIAGIAVSTARQLIVIGDRTEHRLVAFKWHSCFHASRAKSWSVPGQMRSLANLAIDADDTLWMATQVPDNYLNASAYAWVKNAW